MFSLDPFEFYRDLLTVFLTLYFLLTFASMVLRLVRSLRGDDPHRRLLRTYLSYQLVSIRVQPLAGELLQIAFWLLVLISVWQMHRVVA